MKADPFLPTNHSLMAGTLGVGALNQIGKGNEQEGR